MDTFRYVNEFVIPATFELLPEQMNWLEARAMVMAIGLQESKFLYRRQVGGGPARGFWQFERGGGIFGVMQHKSTSKIIAAVLRAMCYDPINTTVSYEAVENNDILACAYARLLLWTDPKPLPVKESSEYAWQYYLRGWRPSKPHRETWDAYYAQAWEAVEGQ